jgi:hypothetical protein
VAFSYAGFLDIQWQLLIIVSFLFVGTLAFFSVLFNDTSNEFTTFVTIQEDDTEYIGYQNSITASYG